MQRVYEPDSDSDKVLHTAESEGMFANYGRSDGELQADQIDAESELQKGQPEEDGSCCTNSGSDMDDVQAYHAANVNGFANACIETEIYNEDDNPVLNSELMYNSDVHV